MGLIIDEQFVLNKIIPLVSLSLKDFKRALDNDPVLDYPWAYGGKGEHQGTLFHVVCQAGDIEKVKYMLTRTKMLNYQGVNIIGATPLMVAAMCDRLDIVSLLLAAGADASLKSGRGLTALGLASVIIPSSRTTPNREAIIRILRGDAAIGVLEAELGKGA